MLRGRLVATNIGDTIWLADNGDDDDFGHVRLGVKIVMAKNAKDAEDFTRVVLEQDVHPGQTAHFDLNIPIPVRADMGARSGVTQLRSDN